MDSSKCIQLLESHDIKPTANRMVVADQLATMEHPVSLTDLEASIGTIDKSNILRTLNLFRANHLVHVIEGGNGCTLYELCQSQHHDNDADNDEDAHIHFFCEKCRQTICLSEKHIPAIDLPEGYSVNSVNFMIKGLCPKCSRSRR